MSGPLILFRTSYLRHLLHSPAEYAAYPARRQQPLPDWLGEKLRATAIPFWLRLLERVDEACAGRPALPFGLRAAASARATRLLRRLGGRQAPPVRFQ